MYYISKIVSNTKCEVTDTKDGVADIVPISYVQDMVDSGVEI